MYVREINNMDLWQIAESGQCFRWERLAADTYAIIAYGHYLEVSQSGKQFTFSCEEEEFHQIWYDYFDLDTDYNCLGSQLDPKDKFLMEAFRYGRGIRILKQDLSEMIISFIISQNNNIKRIKKSIAKLCEKYGQYKKDCAAQFIPEYYSFPEMDDLAKADIGELRELGLGYRDTYVLKTAIRLSGKEGLRELNKLKMLEYQAAMEYLMQFTGIGRKVAGCICLYGLHHIEAFPVDTHIKKTVNQYYPSGFPFEKYDGYAGILQQYMFFYDLKKEKITL